MTLSNWVAVAEITGAIAVVITLIYLAVQVRQSKEALDANTKALRAQAISDVTRNVHEHAHMLLQGQDVAAALSRWASDNDLESHDAILMDFFFGAVIVARQNEYLQWKRGLLDEQVFRAMHHVTLTVLESRHGKHWWDQEARRMLAPDFIEFVEELQRSSSSEEFDSWKRAVRLSDRDASGAASEA